MATKVITGKVRASFVHIFEPQSVNGSEPKYSCSFIIPKSDTETIGKIREAVEQARQDGVTKWGGKIPPNLKLPLRDGDIERPDDEAYADSWFLNANSRQAPQTATSGPAWWTAGACPSPTRWRSIPAAMSGRRSPSTPSTPTATAASPADCRTSRSGATVSR